MTFLLAITCFALGIVFSSLVGFVKHLLTKQKIALEVPALDYIARTKQLVNDYEPLDASGEWKRHNVYATLQKEFPSVKRYVLALAIEQIVSELRTKND